MAVPASVVARNTNTSSATSRGGGGQSKAEGGKTNRVTREITSKERPAEDKKGLHGGAGASLAQTSAKASQLNKTVMTPMPEGGSGPAAGRQTYLPSFAWESFFSPSTTQTGGQAAREMRDKEGVAFIQNTTGSNNTGYRADSQQEDPTEPRTPSNPTTEQHYCVFFVNRWNHAGPHTDKNQKYYASQYRTASGAFSPTPTSGCAKDPVPQFPPAENGGRAPTPFTCGCEETRGYEDYEGQETPFVRTASHFDVANPWRRDTRDIGWQPDTAGSRKEARALMAMKVRVYVPFDETRFTGCEDMQNHMRSPVNARSSEGYVIPPENYLATLLDLEGGPYEWANGDIGEICIDGKWQETHLFLGQGHGSYASRPFNRCLHVTPAYATHTSDIEDIPADPHITHGLLQPSDALRFSSLCVRAPNGLYRRQLVSEGLLYGPAWRKPERYRGCDRDLWTSRWGEDLYVRFVKSANVVMGEGKTPFRISRWSEVARSVATTTEPESPSLRLHSILVEFTDHAGQPQRECVVMKTSTTVRLPTGPESKLPADRELEWYVSNDCGANKGFGGGIVGVLTAFRQGMTAGEAGAVEGRYRVMTSANCPSPGVSSVDAPNGVSPCVDMLTWLGCTPPYRLLDDRRFDTHTCDKDSVANPIVPPHHAFTDRFQQEGMGEISGLGLRRDMSCGVWIFHGAKHCAVVMRATLYGGCGLGPRGRYHVYCPEATTVKIDQPPWRLTEDEPICQHAPDKPEGDACEVSALQDDLTAEFGPSQYYLDGNWEAAELGGKAKHLYRVLKRCRMEECPMNAYRVREAMKGPCVVSHRLDANCGPGTQTYIPEWEDGRGGGILIDDLRRGHKPPGVCQQEYETLKAEWDHDNRQEPCNKECEREGWCLYEVYMKQSPHFHPDITPCKELPIIAIIMRIYLSRAVAQCPSRRRDQILGRVEAIWKFLLAIKEMELEVHSRSSRGLFWLPRRRRTGSSAFFPERMYYCDNSLLLPDLLKCLKCRTSLTYSGCCDNLEISMGQSIHLDVVTLPDSSETYVSLPCPPKYCLSLAVDGEEHKKAMARNIDPQSGRPLFDDKPLWQQMSDREQLIQTFMRENTSETIDKDSFHGLSSSGFASRLYEEVYAGFGVPADQIDDYFRREACRPGRPYSFRRGSLIHVKTTRDGSQVDVSRVYRSQQTEQKTAHGESSAPPVVLHPPLVLHDDRWNVCFEKVACEGKYEDDGKGCLPKVEGLYYCGPKAGVRTKFLIYGARGDPDKGEGAPGSYRGVCFEPEGSDRMPDIKLIDCKIDCTPGPFCQYSWTTENGCSSVTVFMRGLRTVPRLSATGATSTSNIVCDVQQIPHR
ncbi:unnamed protein product [Vitrella brassicaformis CCMP3155]|uniref:Uncharacterized protein n=4 Tax=Vitrella brassicaformis TaxID=1169539 RepID=A0A0G4H3F0_VITBC|nr:unnamed protein product [Vitrella brassicaformis CCMP3155]|eukprot:CEM37990.1 unnamed protein product [Vitrella brassicaformis CCMP3155]